MLWEDVVTLRERLQLTTIKVKCDRSQPECQKCLRLGVICPGYRQQDEDLSPTEIRLSAEAIYKASGLAKRQVGSCEACRTSKTRCTKTRPVCRRCLARNIRCTYNTRGASPHTSTASQSSKEASTSAPFATMDPRLDDEALRLRLLSAFFDRVHPLRCLSFVHKPSFMYALDHGILEQEYEAPLVDAMCALGARQLFLDSPRGSSESLNVTGQALSERAYTKTMAQLHNPTTQQLMTAVLLCEYATKTDRHAMAFVLAGCTFRQLCLLALDRPDDKNAEPEVVSIERKVENRLVWACYSLDVGLASGVDNNSSWRERCPTVALPCSGSEFHAQSLPKSRTLHQVLTTPVVTRELDLPALNAVLMHLRMKVLR